MKKGIEERLRKAESDLSSVSRIFLRYLSTSELSELEFISLSTTLTRHGVVLFSRQLRGLIASRNQEIRSDQKAQFWELIDAIGFWEDAHPGSWPYTTIKDFTRLLQWVEEVTLRMNWKIHTNEVYYAKFLPPGTLDALSRKSLWKQGMEINAIVQSSNAKQVGWDQALQLIGDIRRKYADSSEI